MNKRVDISYKSLNKKEEILCGDKVEIVRNSNSVAVILADGMGSGIKANILATMTSKILATMISEGASLEECVHTIAETLPICKVRDVAYATFTILQIFNNGEGYLIEYDNPSCIFIRNNNILEIPHSSKIIGGKKINEYRFKIEEGDTFLIMSDGAINAGAGEILNYGWQWQDIADYALSKNTQGISPKRLATIISDACNELYLGKAGDDTTIACVKIVEKKRVHLLTGPPQNKEVDERMVEDYVGKEESITRIICGGTSAALYGRVMGKNVKPSTELTERIPPISYIEDIDLVTEGIVTLNAAICLLEEYANSENLDISFFEKLDKKNGASLLAKILIERCTDLYLFVGDALNENNIYSGDEINNIARNNLVKRLCEVMGKLGKETYIKRY